MRKYIRHPSDIPIEINSNLDQSINSQNLVNVSLGGLSFYCNDAVQTGQLLSIRIPVVDPPFETVAQVVWSKPQGEGFEIGVKLLDQDDAYKTRMVEQVCHIEHYKKEVFESEGRELTGEEAAMEWIQKYAQTFPKIHEAESI